MGLNHSNLLGRRRGRRDKAVARLLEKILKGKGLIRESGYSPKHTQVGPLLDRVGNSFAQQHGAREIRLWAENNESSLLVSQYQICLANAIIYDLTYSRSSKAAQEIM